MQRYELVDGTSNKFWEIELAGKTVTVRFGRIGTTGTTGQTQVKTHASPAAARKEYDKLVAAKTQKGYRSAKASAKAGPPKPPTDGAPRDVVALRKLAATAREGDEAMARAAPAAGSSTGPATIPTPAGCSSSTRISSRSTSATPARCTCSPIAPTGPGTEHPGAGSPPPGDNVTDLIERATPG